MKKIFILLCCLFATFFSFSQKIENKKDSLKLPFEIAKEKRLSDEELENKKEGFYVTGVPDLSSDPLTGFGFGAEAQLFFNGKRSDPFFAYTDTRAEIDITAFYTTKYEREFRMECEIPYIFNTKWRFHGEIGYEVNPNLLYFGVGEQSLQPLSYFPNNDPTKPIVNNASYNDYTNSLTGARVYYNTYQKSEAVVNLIVARSFAKGKCRVFLGFELTHITNISPLNDSSLVHRDALSAKILGYGSDLTPLLQTGLIYDTREGEKNPSNGVFAEFTNELSLKAFGSPFDFDKAFVHYNLYKTIFPKIFKQLIFAGRVGLGYLMGEAPFYEYSDEESSEQTIEGLGGPQTLRGYVQDRFASRVLGFANFELRCRFAQCKFLKQHLVFSAAPFEDIGGVWDNLNRISQTQNLRYSEGLGLRIAWNENTVLRFDYAISKEDRQFFFTLKQAF